MHTSCFVFLASYYLLKRLKNSKWHSLRVLPHVLMRFVKFLIIWQVTFTPCHFIPIKIKKRKIKHLSKMFKLFPINLNNCKILIFLRWKFITIKLSSLVYICIIVFYLYVPITRISTYSTNILVNNNSNDLWSCEALDVHWWELRVPSNTVLPNMIDP